MPRLKLDHKKEYIQLVIDPEDKSRWKLGANDTSMSDCKKIAWSAATVHSNGDESQHLGAIAITTSRSSKKLNRYRNSLGDFRLLRSLKVKHLTAGKTIG